MDGSRGPWYSEKPSDRLSLRNADTIHEMHLKGLLAILMLVLCGGTLFAQEPSPPANGTLPSSLEKMIFTYDVLREELKKPILDLQAKYEGALDRLSLESQQAGKLERVLILKEEREGFAAGQFPEANDFPPLLNLRAVYQRELAKLLIPLNSEEARLKTELLEGMGDLKTELTKSGRLDEAVRMAETMARLKTARSLEDEILNGKALFVLKTPEDQVGLSGCILDVKEDLFHLSMMAGQSIGKVTTKASFSPPFVATWDVSTDGGNIRFYYAQLTIILNHESGRQTLQVMDPALGNQLNRMIPELGRVSTDEFHRVHLIVDEDRYAFVVNGEVRAEGEGDYKGLDDAVSIGPAFGSQLRLRHFEIHR